MHTQATQPLPAATTTSPLPAATECPHCGTLPIGSSHREDCFPNFQAELLRTYPALREMISLSEAEVVERIFRSWTHLIRILRPRFVASANNCVERRWWEVSSYVERRLARHARRCTVTGATAAAS